MHGLMLSSVWIKCSLQYGLNVHSPQYGLNVARIATSHQENKRV